MTAAPSLLFGVPIADVTMDETIAIIGRLVADGRATGSTHQVCTVNVDFLVNAISRPDIAAILRDAELCFADGMPVVWASHLLGMPVRERVAGADLVPALVEASATSGWHVHVFGSDETVAAAATALLSSRYPGARFSIDPGPRIDDPTVVDADLLDRICAVDADILCVALGNPKQEQFIAANRARLGCPVMIGVGGSLDMLVGKRKRAPAWLRKIGLEWMFRAVQEPRRLGRRYAHDLRVWGPAIFREFRAVRARRHRLGLSAAHGADEVTLSFRSGAALDHDDYVRTASALANGAPLRISFPPSPPHDRAVAQLIGLVRAAGASRVHVTWTGVPESCPEWCDELRLTPATVGLPPS